MGDRGGVVLNEGIPRASAVIGIMASAVGIWQMFPQIEGIGQGFGMGKIPFPLFVLSGIAIGTLLNFTMDRFGKNATKVLRSLIVAYLIWMVAGLVSALSTGEGGIAGRVQDDRIMGLWFASFFMLISMLPGMFGGYAIVSASKVGMSGTVGSLLLIPLICMVYSEARYNLLLDQGMVPSIASIWGLALFVESMGMMRRLREFEDSTVSRSIITRNILFLLAFALISSMVSIAPFFIGPFGTDIYELGTIYGKAIMGLFLLVPLAILALIRREG